MIQKICIYLLLISLAASGFTACKKKNTAQTAAGSTAEATMSPDGFATEGTETPTPGPGTEPVVVPYETPTVTKEEAKVMVQEQAKVVQEAKAEEKQAEKAVAEKVVVSSVAESAPIPDGFPVQNVPIMQGAQIVSASKNGNQYQMVLRVNVPAKDAYKYYFDLYDAIGSVKIKSKTENSALSIERSKSGLVADFAYADETENTSTVSINLTQEG